MTTNKTTGINWLDEWDAREIVPVSALGFEQLCEWAAQVALSRRLSDASEKSGTGIDWVAVCTARGIIPVQEVKTAPDPIYTMMPRSVLQKMCETAIALSRSAESKPSAPAPQGGEDWSGDAIEDFIATEAEPFTLAGETIRNNPQWLGPFMWLSDVDFIVKEAVRRALASRQSGAI